MRNQGRYSDYDQDRFGGGRMGRGYEDEYTDRGGHREQGRVDEGWFPGGRGGNHGESRRDRYYEGRFTGGRQENGGPGRGGHGIGGYDQSIGQGGQGGFDQGGHGDQGLYGGFARGYDQVESGEDKSARFDDDYNHWRQEQITKLDEDYSAWQSERRKKFSDEFDKWRSDRNKTAGQAAEQNKKM